MFELKKEDQVLACFPKTGSTWVRFFIFCVLCQRREGQVLTIDCMNEAMPEFANASFFLDWRFEECNRIVKTHQRFLPFFKGKRAALVVRDPRDISVSYYHYLSGLKGGDSCACIAEVLRHPRYGLENFFVHYGSWFREAGLVIRYEDLLENPFEHFRRLLVFYGIERTSDEIAAAIEAADFDQMRMAQSRSVKLNEKFREGHQFLRSGKTSQWEEILEEEDLKLYQALAIKYSFDLYE